MNQVHSQDLYLALGPDRSPTFLLTKLELGQRRLVASETPATAIPHGVRGGGYKGRGFSKFSTLIHCSVSVAVLNFLQGPRRMLRYHRVFVVSKLFEHRDKLRIAAIPHCDRGISSHPA